MVLRKFGEPEATRTAVPEGTHILAVAPYANPHLLPIYDALAAQPGLRVTRASLHALPRERTDLGWAEMAEDAPYLQPWRRLGDRWALRRELLAADVAILPGPFHFKRLPLDFAWRLAFSSGPILAWSEPFLAFRERSRLNLAALAAVAGLLDSRRVELLAIGTNAVDDYRAVGVTRWRARSFAFAVEPRPDSGPRPEHGGGPIRLLFAGDLIERKRVDVLLDALGSGAVPREGWTLEIVGDGPEAPALARQVERLGLERRVQIRPAMRREVLLARLPEADAVILPSRFDGWGAIVNEAMEARVACVVSDACGAASLLDHGRSGLVFRAGDARDLAACLGRVIGERGLAARLGDAGHAAIVAQRPGIVAERLAALCRGHAGHAPEPAFETGLLRPLP